MTSVLGIDLSLTSTGLAGIQDGEVWLARIRSTGKKGDGLALRQARLASILTDALCVVAKTSPGLVVLESPSYGSSFGSPHDRSGLWWLLVQALARQGVPIATVSPQGRAKYGTGRGGSKKPVVYAAVKERYPHLSFACDDEADALLLASMGARHLGFPIEELPESHLAAMAGAAWPT